MGVPEACGREEPTSTRICHLRRPTAFRLLAIAVVAAGLRIPLLDLRGLWRDEISQAIAASSSLAHLFETVRGQSAAAPLDYIGTWLTMHLVPDPTIGPRLWPLMAGVAAVPIAAGAASAWFDRRAGLVAAIAAALSPMLVHYSAEARFYVLGATLAFAYLWALRSQRAVWICLISAAGLLTMYSFAILLLIGGAWLAWRRAWRPLVAQATGSLALVPWALYALPAHLARTYDYAPTSLPKAVWVAATDFTAIDPIWALAALALAAWVAWRSWRQADARWLVVMSMAVILIMWAAIERQHYFWQARAAILALPPFLLAVAGGIAATPRWKYLVAAWVVLMAPALVTEFSIGNFAHEQWREASARLTATTGVIAADHIALQSLTYYAPELASRLRLEEPARYDTAIVAQATRPTIPRPAPPDGWRRQRLQGLLIDYGPSGN